ncbi:hypothetical protein CAL18_12415 [Bordetella genomosp. 7]|uniref:head-tail connector protein n=1 Tax=Bordetella genomosp. 7 TaxID=1416805 RepID=UPI000B9DED35|nr:head-tail connector protein [Bordetella genomosp. 7]OZI21724.1 hypothetical protein CAL18_12415 [Bordetella genomosp. 7]
MALVTLEQARLHLRVDETEEDSLIALWINAAEQSAQSFLGRNVYTDQAELDAAVNAGTAGDDPMVVNDLIRAAILLTVGHLYANREDVAAGVSFAKMPVGAEYLLMPHRVKMGV